MSRHTRLYTEMVTTGAILHGDRERFLAFNEAEHPVALQVGGSNPSELAECAQIAEDYGYDEINLNCGCPSDRVQNGKIGACLMAEPALVGECVQAMQQKVNIPVTVKHRIGIDDLDSDEQLIHFVKTVTEAGSPLVIVHARKAWLSGLSPKENREIPPLEYQRVHALKKHFSNLPIIINGGLKTIEDCKKQLSEVEGVMIGREAYSNPYLLSQVDKALFDDHSPRLSRDEILEAFTEYCAQQIAQGTRLHHMSRHVLGLYSGQKGGRVFRRFISENACKKDADHSVLRQARAQMG